MKLISKTTTLNKDTFTPEIECVIQFPLTLEQSELSREEIITKLGTELLDLLEQK